ncbi:MAG TPA: DUF2339 domain-containing protein [Steroidobacteraceae bacterium]|nr:DUF2339 domain-containing protein [Steroidobacteraceae bacterium]
MAEREKPTSKGLTIGLAIGGAIVGGSIAEFSGVCFGAVLGALLAQILHLRGRTRALSEQLQALEGRVDRARVATPSEPVETQPPPESDIARAPAVEPAAVAEPSPEPLAPAAAANAATPEPVTPRIIVKTTPTFVDSLVERAITWAKGGNPLARIGIVILFFGGAFLAKYAADHSLFPVELRFLLIALGAFALLFIGWRLRDARSVYAQILQGGGIAGLYLTVFAATRFHLLPLTLALGLMVFIALAGAVLAVAQNALSLAVIATAGGFAAPLLVSTGSGNHIALFSYYALLNLGVFAVAWFRTWRVLNVLGFFFTFTITGLWRAAAYAPSNLVSADAFLILFFLMYVGVSILNCVRQPPNLKGYVSGSLVFGLPVVAFSLHASLVHRIEYALAWSALALGTFYLVVGWTLYRTRRESFRLLVEAFAALGVIFASLAIPLAFDTRTTAAMWAVEGAGLLWLGVRQERKLARAFGTLLQFAAGVGFLIHVRIATQPILNGAFIGALMLALSGYFSGYWLHRNRAREAGYERGVHIVYAAWATAWWLLAGLHEIDRFVNEARLGAALTYVAFTALALETFAAKSRWPMPRWIALYLPAASAVFGLGHALDLEHPFAQWGAVGWVALVIAHYVLLRAWDLRPGTWGNNPDFTPQVPRPTPIPWLHAGALWLIALLIAGESSWQIDQRTMGVWPVLPWGLVPALTLALLGRRELKPAWPLVAHEHAYRVTAGVVLAMAACVWILLVNLTRDGAPDWLPYLPLLNPLDVSVALTFAALALWWTALPRETHAFLLEGRTKPAIALIATLAFIWLNAALLRALHHGWSAPLSVDGMIASTLVQASLSIFWGLLGFVAMTAGAKRHWRIVWLVGASLMVVVVLKLFLVDLSNSGTLARIASFLTVGALLLVTGYLAPLPPRQKEAHIA